MNLRSSAYDVYIGRAGRGEDGYFGNPLPLLPGQPRGSTIEKYRAWFFSRLQSDSEFKRRVLGLAGKRLGCFCAPLPCHGNVIADYIDANLEARV